MKKLFLLGLLFTYSVTFYAQETKTTTELKTTKKTGYDYNKDVDVKTPAKKDAVKTETKSKTTEKKVADKKETVSKDTKKKTPTLKESNEKAPKKADKVTGEYNGHKVYTGPKGGKYYINKNGNKTYIQD